MPFMFRDVRVFRGAIFHRQGRHASEGMRVNVKEPDVGASDILA